MAQLLRMVEGMARLRCTGLLALAALFAVVASPRAAAEARVYLLRGLMDVSTGLDELALKLKRRGIAATIGSFTAEEELAAAALKGFRSGAGCPVVLIGHSLGADAAIGIARTLQGSGVPVGLLVAFSPNSSDAMPGNVSRAVNYYQSNSFWSNVYSRGAGFKGTLRNVDLAKDDKIDHFNIEKAARLHAETIRAIESLERSCAPARKEQAHATSRP
jgi:pimeloyl-ACP methyl ester carboxylesterase